jgi:hypothetical protein
MHGTTCVDRVGSKGGDVMLSTTEMEACGCPRAVNDERQWLGVLHMACTPCTKLYGLSRMYFTVSNTLVMMHLKVPLVVGRYTRQ